MLELGKVLEDSAIAAHELNGHAVFFTGGLFGIFLTWRHLPVHDFHRASIRVGFEKSASWLVYVPAFAREM